MEKIQINKFLHLQRLRRHVLHNLWKEIADIDALCDEGEKALESFALLGIEAAVEERGNVNVIGIIIEVGISSDPEYEGGGPTETVRCRRPELGKHLFEILSSCQI